MSQPPAVATGGQQTRNRRRRAGLAVVVEDQLSALHVCAAEVEHGVLRGRSQLQRPGRHRGQAAVRVAAAQIDAVRAELGQAAAAGDGAGNGNARRAADAGIGNQIDRRGEGDVRAGIDGLQGPLPSPVPARSIGSSSVPDSPPPALSTAPLATTVFPLLVPRALRLRICRLPAVTLVCPP